MDGGSGWDGTHVDMTETRTAVCSKSYPMMWCICLKAPWNNAGKE